MSRQRFFAIVGALAALAALVIVLVHEDSTRQAPAAWCAGPGLDPAGAAALTKAVDQEVADIGTYAPGQPVDRRTLELELMARCGR